MIIKGIQNCNKNAIYTMGIIIISFVCVFVLQPAPEMLGESILSFTLDFRPKNLCGKSKG